MTESVYVVDDPLQPIPLTVTGQDLTGKVITGSALIAVDDPTAALDALETAADTPVEGTSSLRIEPLTVVAVDPPAGAVEATPGAMFSSVRPGVYGFEVSADGVQVLRGTLRVLGRYPEPPEEVC